MGSDVALAVLGALSAALGHAHVVHVMELGGTPDAQGEGVTGTDSPIRPPAGTSRDEEAENSQIVPSVGTNGEEVPDTPTSGTAAGQTGPESVGSGPGSGGTAPAGGGRGGTPPGLAFGAILVVAGAILLVAQLVDVDIDAFGWPSIIVGIGVVLLVIGLTGSRDSGLVVGGTVTTAVGLLLAFQNATGLWATWAYAWALVGPAASGLGLAIHGLRSGNANDVRNGTWGLLGGLALFAIGFLFFEGIIGLSGFDVAIADWVLPAAVIGIGVVILGRAVLQRDDRGSSTG